LAAGSSWIGPADRVADALASVCSVTLSDCFGDVQINAVFGLSLTGARVGLTERMVPVALCPSLEKSRLKVMTK
jgi:hypothetical protein